LIHIYYGTGKGKTTAAVGLMMRALGCNKRIVFAQFLKDGLSSEIKTLKKLCIKTYVLNDYHGFFYQRSDNEIGIFQKKYLRLFEEIIDEAEKNIDVLVLDEIISACECGLFPESTLIKFLRHMPKNLEVILTGHNPSEELLKMADYITEMKKLKHPYDQGIKARKGIEY